MEETPVQSILDWVDVKVGNTLAKLRNQFFKKPTRGQNLTDENLEVLATG